MAYITMWNLARIHYEKSERKITVKTKAGDLHTFSCVEGGAKLHTKSDCKAMSQPFGEKRNSGSSFVMNYSVKRLEESSYLQDGEEMGNFAKTLFFQLGFTQCMKCWQEDSLDDFQADAYKESAEYHHQHERDLEQLKGFFESHPADFDRFLGIDD